MKYWGWEIIARLRLPNDLTAEVRFESGISCLSISCLALMLYQHSVPTKCFPFPASSPLPPFLGSPNLNSLKICILLNQIVQVIKAMHTNMFTLKKCIPSTECVAFFPHNVDFIFLLHKVSPDLTSVWFSLIWQEFIYFDRKQKNNL